MPPSRVEPVPMTMSRTEFALTYESSPDVISYQYEQSGSPPRCSKHPKQLCMSPTHKKEARQDTHPDYNFNPDSMAAMRATDLHCGRGSSPLRTKLKQSPKSSKMSPRRQSPSKLSSRKMSPIRMSPNKMSPRKHQTNVFYYMDNGMINITTPSKSELQQTQNLDSSPKSELIDALKDSNAALASFQRTTKASALNSTAKSNSDLFGGLARTQNRDATTFSVNCVTKTAVEPSYPVNHR